MDIEWAGRMSDLNQTFQAILREHDDDGIGESARLYERIERVFNLFSCGEGYAASRMSDYLSDSKGLLHAIDIERLRIEKGFQQLAESITGANLIQLRPDRPVVVTAPEFQPGSFGPTADVQAGHPVPTDTSDLVPEPKKHADGPFDRAPDGHDRYVEQGPA